MHVSTLGSFSTTKHERLDGTDAAQFGCVSTTAANGDSVSVSCWHPSFYVDCAIQHVVIGPKSSHVGYSEAEFTTPSTAETKEPNKIEDPTLHKRGYRIRVIHTKAGILQSMRLVYTDCSGDTHRERNGWEPHYSKNNSSAFIEQCSGGTLKSIVLIL